MKLKPSFQISSILLFVLFFTTYSINTVEAQKLKAGPQDLSFFSPMDDADQPYAVYIPDNFDESRSYPLVVFLHGAYSNHRLGLRRLFGVGNSQGYDFIKPGSVPYENDVEATRYWPPFTPVDYIAAAPYARGTAGYQGIPEQDVYEMIDDIKSRFLIDEDRIYLTGLSMGGGGTLWLGLTRPDIWAAIAPVCPAPPEGITELAGNASNMPVHLFVGDKDFLYPVVSGWKAKLETTAQRLDYIEYPGVGHNSWEWAYKDGFIFEWFSQFRRDLYPEQVRFSSRWFKYNKAYWVKFDDLVPGQMATIDAKFTGNNRIEVQTTGLEAFTLNLAGHPMFDTGKKVSLTVDGRSFSLKSADAVSFTKTRGSWANRKFTPGLTAKQPGGEGPISAAVAGSHLYVYGTGGDPSREELAARRAQAAAAADWTGRGGRIMVFPRVISDQQVRQSDYVTSNLILFGTRETNAVIEKFADRLPLHLYAGTGDYGLLYIYPMNRHYLLISSGLPWWTPPKQAAREQSLTFMGSNIEMLKEFGDFILFRESPDNVISQGTFDNDWKLSQPDAAALQSSEVISLR
jgi:dienelactone hydrolase